MCRDSQTEYMVSRNLILRKRALFEFGSLMHYNKRLYIMFNVDVLSGVMLCYGQWL